jgi:hypothetical protein
MFVKIFAQILDSSIAEDWIVRHVFEDFLKLADREGFVDMTPEAISRRTNVPLDIITRGIEKLSMPDPNSRSLEEEGRRVVLIDPQRPWGWRIVNYSHYRNIRDGEDRKAYFRERKAEQRARSKTVQDKSGQSENVTNVTQAEADAEVDALSDTKVSSPRRAADGDNSDSGIDPGLFVDLWNQRRGDLPKVVNFTKGRRDKVKARIKAGLTLDRFIEAIKNCREKRFLSGDNDRGWVATFDWLVANSENIEKAIENPYGGSFETLDL